MVHRRLLNPQRQPADVQAFDGSGGAAQDWDIVSCINVIQRAAAGLVFSQERRSEAQAALAVGAGVAIHTVHELGERAGRRRESLQAGLKGGH